MIQFPNPRSGTRQIHADSNRSQRHKFSDLIDIKPLDIVHMHHISLHRRQTVIYYVRKLLQHICRILCYDIIIRRPVTDIIQTRTIICSPQKIDSRTRHRARHITLRTSVFISDSDKAATFPQTTERILQCIIGIILITGNIQCRSAQTVPHADEYFREFVACHYY